jgi:hypothetical protein
MPQYKIQEAQSAKSAGVNVDPDSGDVVMQRPTLMKKPWDKNSRPWPEPCRDGQSRLRF